jgi:phospholipid-binding lipoprotein MlaA
VLLVGLSLPVQGCITYPPGWDVETQGRDPYERVNRAFFGFNRGLDRWILRPLSRGWTFITPRAVRTHVDKFFVNLQFPRRFLANLGQAEMVGAGSELGRFVINTTVGIVGFFDPASRMGLRMYDEDFGQMFGRWGIPAGPYWVIPVLGPSNPRDGVAAPFDLILDLRNLSPVPGPGLLAAINARALIDPQITAAQEAALDLYVATREASIDRRRALVANEDRDVRRARMAVPDELYEVGTEVLEAEEAVDVAPTPEPIPEPTTEPVQEPEQE